MSTPFKMHYLCSTPLKTDAYPFDINRDRYRMVSSDVRAAFAAEGTPVANRRNDTEIGTPQGTPTARSVKEHLRATHNQHAVQCQQEPLSGWTA